jgi:predicted phage terminase large subunit-like protein
VFRQRLEYPDLKRKIVANAARFGAPTVVIEDTGAGASLIQDIRRDRGQCRPIPFKPEGEKEMRMAVHTPLIEAGQVYLPEAAPWLAAFQTEVMQFPNSKHDDQVDSMSQCFAWWEYRSRRRGFCRDF